MKKVLYSPNPTEYKRQLEFLMAEWLKHNNIDYAIDEEIEKAFNKYATKEARDILQQARVGFVEYRLSDHFNRAQEKFRDFVCLVEEAILVMYWRLK